MEHLEFINIIAIHLLFSYTHIEQCYYTDTFAIVSRTLCTRSLYPGVVYFGGWVGWIHLGLGMLQITVQLLICYKEYNHKIFHGSCKSGIKLKKFKDIISYLSLLLIYYALQQGQTIDKPWVY